MLGDAAETLTPRGRLARGRSTLKIIEYPHPTLRHKSKPLKRVDAEIRAVVGEMFERMIEAKGVGLAANQVDLPYRLFVFAVVEEPDDKPQEGVFINPVISRPEGTDEAEEGCLSLPGLYAPVKRPAVITLSAYNLEGEEVNLELDGLFGRIVQHETDHLDGVLFIDRISPAAEADVRDELLEFQSQFEARRAAGEIPDDETITRRLAEIETEFC